MKQPLWIAQAAPLATSQLAVEFYEFLSLVLGVLIMPFVGFALLYLYSRTANRLYLFFMPSAVLLCWGFGSVFADFWMYIGLHIEIPGLGWHISSDPLIKTCEIGTAVMGTRDNLACDLDVFWEWLPLRYGGAGGWIQSSQARWTPKLFENVVESGIALVLGGGLVGSLLLTVRGIHNWCHGCERRCSSDEMRGNDPNDERPRCTRCRDPEVGLWDEKRQLL